ncbi:MAG: hypothetical protein WKF77_27965 [Planctomycetaceae bacterium]
MSTVLEQPKTPHTSEPDCDPQLPDASVLEDRTPEWIRTRPASALFVLLIGAVFVVMASRPLWHTDLWDHLNYGQNIIESKTVSDTEPLLRLCRGVPMVNIPWLAQVGMAGLNNQFGLTSLQFLFASLIAFSLAIVAWRGSRMSHSVVGGIVAAGIFLKVNLDQLLVIRPQLAGVVLYCLIVAWSLGRRRNTKAAWIGLPLIFMLWANLHGSFSIGLLMMGIAAVGRFGDVLIISKSLRIALLDRELHRDILLIQLCAAAVLLNPSGLAIYPEVMNMAGSANIGSMFEWDALTLRSAQGQSAAAAALLAFMAIKLSPRRLHCGEMLAFVITGLLAMWSARMLNWWAPVAGILTGTHLLAAMRKTTVWLKRTQPVEAKGLWTVVSVLLIVLIFLPLTNFGILILKGHVAPAERLVSKETPLATAAFLGAMETVPRGVSFVPAEWAGFVMNRVPGVLEPMVNLHVHLIPEQVWSDYIRLVNGPTDWNSLMDEYGINMAVVDKDRQSGLTKRIRESADWTALYEDRQAIVFVRNKEI